MSILRGIGTLAGWLIKVAGVLIVLCSALGAGWVVLVATVFWLGYSTEFDWAIVGPTLLIGAISALVGVVLFYLGRLIAAVL